MSLPPLDARFARAQRRLTDPAWRPYATVLQQRAEHFRRHPGTPIPTHRHNWILEAARWHQRRVLTVAAWARITREPSAVADTLRLLHEIDAWERMSWEGTFDLTAGEAAATIGLTVQWLGDLLTPEARRRLVDLLATRVLPGYLVACPSIGPRAWWHAAPMNWTAVCNGGLLIACLALPETPGAAEARPIAEEGLQAYQTLGINADGSSSESVGYWSYGVTYLLQAALAWQQAGLGRHPALDLPVFGSGMDFPFAFSARDGAGLGFGDSNYFLPPPLLFAACALNGRGDIADEMHRRLMPTCATPAADLDPILDFLPIEVHALLDAEEPGDRQLPRPAQASWPTAGWHLLRSGRLRLGLRGGTTDGPHTMRELGAITLADDDHVLLTGIEHWPYLRGWFIPEARAQFWEDSTGAKCAPLVNGIGQVRRARAVEVTLPDGVQMEATAAYPSIITGVHRTVRRSDDHLVIEDAVACDLPAIPESRFLSHGTFSAIDASTWRVQHRGSSAILRFAADAPLQVTPSSWPQADPRRPAMAGLRVHALDPVARWHLTTTITDRCP